MKDPALGQVIRSNPVSYAHPKAPKPYQTRRAKALTKKQIAALLNVAQARAKSGDLTGKRDYAMLLLYIATGLRRSEVIQMPNEPGEPLSSWSFVGNLRSYARDAGIGKFNLHQTRHTFARMVVERTGSLSETQEALGHRHMATTRVYVDSVAKKPDKHSRHILAALDLPELEEAQPFYDPLLGKADDESVI